MNGPQHFRQAEKLLEHAAAVLAATAAIGLSAHSDQADELAQRDVAASPA
jgi:hypothetical protein